MPDTTQSRAIDRSLVSEEPWEVETVHEHFPKRTHQEVKTALEAAKKELKGSESLRKLWRF